MARLWLCATLATMLTLGGCLFVGDVNGRPSVQLDVQETSTAIGVPVVFLATLYDDQPLPHVEIGVRDANGDVPDACDFVISNTMPADASPQSFSITFWQAGTYTVEATPIDALGAQGSNASVQIGVAVVPPSFGDASTVIAPENAGTACGSLYPSGAPIPIRLNEIVSDPEASAMQLAPATDQGKACPAAPKLAFVWEHTTLPNNSTASLGLPNGTTCPATPANGVDLLVTDASVDLVCLYIDNNLPAASPSMYGITFSAQQGAEKTTSDMLMIPAIGDAPACLDGVYPVVGSYVLAGDQVTVFQAIAVDDVSPAASLDYLWSIEGPNDTSYTPLGVPATAAEGGDRFSFDPTTLGFAVGDEVHLRVEVSDPAQAAPACAPSDDVCSAASCAAAPATTCPRRATWDIEVR